MQLQKVKNELMCLGAVCSPDAFDFVFSLDPLIGANKQVHSSCIFLEDLLPVNIPITERYCMRSPYSIVIDNGNLALLKHEQYICSVQIMSAPDWYNKRTNNGILMRDVLCVHGKNVLSLTHYHGCYYTDIGKQCKYCSVQSYDNRTGHIKKEDFLETVSAAILENPSYSLALSGGVRNSIDRGAVFFSNLLQYMRSNGVSIETSVELAPPNNNTFIEKLKTNGAKSIIMNMEFSNDDTRRIYCPGKGEISNKRYFDALEFSVAIFGEGNVASVLICGLEPPNDTIKCAQALIKTGVIPILIPFKPYDNCIMSTHDTTDPDVFDMIESKVSELFCKASICPCSSGCIACGSCNSKFY